MRDLKHETSLLDGILAFMSCWILVLSWVEHENTFITLRPGWFEPYSVVKLEAKFSRNEAQLKYEILNNFWYLTEK